MSFFEHIAAADDSERVARRKSSVIAAQRFQNQFGAFLKGASSKEDFQARLALIDSDIKEMTYDVAEEYGGDPQVIESAVRRHFLGAAHTVEERDGKYFVVEDGGAETVAGPFDERQEAQDRASELDELEPLEKKEAAMDNDQWRRAIEGLLSDIKSMYGKTPSDAEYLAGSSADEDLLSGLRDFVEYHKGPNPAQAIKGIFSDINSMWGGGGFITEYVKDVLQNEWSDDTFADMHEDGEAHYGSTKIAVRRPKMCPYHSELTEASLQAGEPQYAAFSSLVGGNSHCKGSFDGKCNFKPEMVTQEFWDAKAEQAAERKQLREQQQQEVVEIAEEPIEEPIEEPVAENTELTDEISEAPSAVGEMSFEGESADMGEEAMAMTANQKDRSNPPAARNYPPDPGLARGLRQYQPGNPVRPGDTPVSEKYPSATKLVDTVPGGADPQLHPEEVSGAGIPLDEDPYHQLTEEEVRRINLMRDKAAKFASLKQAKDCDCWEGYKRVPGTKPCAPGSCEKCDSSKKASRRQASERNANFAEFVNEAARMFPDAGAKIETNNKGEIILIVDDHLAGENAEDQILELAQSYGLQVGDPDRMGYGPNAIFSGDIFPELSWQTGLLSDMPQSIFDAEDEGYEREASRRQANGDSLEVLEEIFYMTEGGEKRHPGMIESVDEKTAERLLKDLEKQGLVEPFEDWIDGARLGNHYDITRKGIQALEQSGRLQREASRRQAEVAWDGGGAVKSEKKWGWGHQEPKADESGLDDAPSGPAMDKTRWQPAALDPNGKGNLKPVDTEYPGSPNPTIQEVLWQRREDEDVYGQQEFGDGTNSVTEQQELPAADETGLTTEKNLDQGSQGGTFPNEGQANPVTSKVTKKDKAKKADWQRGQFNDFEPTDPNGDNGHSFGWQGRPECNGCGKRKEECLDENGNVIECFDTAYELERYDQGGYHPYDYGLPDTDW